jgi:hypothetical protein
MKRQTNKKYAARDMLNVYRGRVLFGVGDRRRLCDDNAAKVRASSKRCKRTFRPQNADSNSTFRPQNADSNSIETHILHRLNQYKQAGKPSGALMYHWCHATGAERLASRTTEVATKCLKGRCRASLASLKASS